ncbi:MAG TPA: hypothetical protein VJC07_05140 [Candidatus Nanoarchaeia archaeon]|nr:hypothetical protein [Candidatus Nanoarchaeia archaeon]
MEQNNLESKVKVGPAHPIVKGIASGITALGLGLFGLYGFVEGLRSQQHYMAASSIVIAGVAGYALVRRYQNSR